jgi:hypothetical protein
VLVAAFLLFGRGRAGRPGDEARALSEGTLAPGTTAAPRLSARPPAPGPAAGETGDADAVSVDGRWEVANEIEASTHPAYRGLRLGYEITLRQRGRRISGEGRKVSENGAPLPGPRRTPILVTGERKGDAVQLTFMERGAERNTAGTLDWRLSGDGESVSGTFASDAAGSRGSSFARRVGMRGGEPRERE